MIIATNSIMLITVTHITDPSGPTFGDPTQMCLELNFEHCKCLFCPDDSASYSINNVN